MGDAGALDCLGPIKYVQYKARELIRKEPLMEVVFSSKDMSSMPNRDMMEQYMASYSLVGATSDVIHEYLSGLDDLSTLDTHPAKIAGMAIFRLVDIGDYEELSEAKERCIRTGVPLHEQLSLLIESLEKLRDTIESYFVEGVFIWK